MKTASLSLTMKSPSIYPVRTPSRNVHLHRAKAFSLVELLVSIAVVSVLTAISFAAYSKITDIRENTQCIANLRQLGAATMLFTSENNNRYPLMSLRVDGSYKSFWYKELRPYLGAHSTSLGYDRSTATQYNLDTFYCPSVDRTMAYPVTHYGANRYVFVRPDDAQAMNYAHNITAPSHTALYSETLNPTSSNFPLSTWQIIPYQVKSAKDSYFPVDRHGGHVNMVFADGHTESLERTKVLEKFDYYFGDDYFD